MTAIGKQTQTGISGGQSIIRQNSNLRNRAGLEGKRWKKKEKEQHATKAWICHLGLSALNVEDVLP
jgi:hypothetical protein